MPEPDDALSDFAAANEETRRTGDTNVRAAMIIHDISLTLSPALPTWPGDPRPTFDRFLDMAHGDELNVTRWSGSLHTGTHVDAPRHFVADGAAVDELDLNLLMGPATVVEMQPAESIGAAELEALSLPVGVRRLLFKTRNSDLWARGETEFRTNYVGVDESGARWLVAHGIQLVGVDYLSVSAYDATITTHVALLTAQIVIVEGLDFSGVAAGEYQLVCLPLKIAGADGAPARAVLIS
ncbi:MAG: cyclase family protein [Anaerolineales bacterium]